MAVAIKISCPHQAPARRKSWTPGGADENAVVKIPYRGSTGGAVIEHGVRVAIAGEVGRRPQLPATGKSRPISASDKGWSGQIPNCRLIRTGGKQGIIWMGVATKIRHTPQPPAGCKRRAVSAANKNIVVKIPDRCLAGGGALKHIVRVAVAVKIGHCRPSC